MKQIEVTNASVDGTRGSLTPRDRAWDSIAVRWGCISWSGALVRSRRRISRAEGEYGVSGRQHVSVSKGRNDRENSKLTIRFILKIRGILFFSFGDQRLVRFWKSPSYSLGKAETNLFL